MSQNNDPVIVEQSFHNSIETVWKSITEIDQMRQWYFENLPSFKPEVGFEVQFDVTSNDRNFLHLWKVTKVVLLKMIAYSWKYEGYPGDSLVTFELFNENNFTKLKLTHEIRERFPEDIPEFTRGSCMEGWTYFIGESLKEYLGGITK